jgi:hypothetical protein
MGWKTSHSMFPKTRVSFAYTDESGFIWVPLFR